MPLHFSPFSRPADQPSQEQIRLEAIGVCVLLFFFLQLLTYDVLGIPTYTVMIAIGLMERDRLPREPDPGAPLSRPSDF